MARYSQSISKLISQLGRLPGVGHKSAQRLAFHILSMEKEEVAALASSLLEARESTKLCPSCQNYTDAELCDICSSPERNQQLLCVVESPRDVSTMERMRDFKGLYHVLHGVYSPMQNVGLDQIKLRELFTRLQGNSEIKEVIIATNQTAEGEATAMYIARLLKPSGIRVTRIASGLPMGSDLEFADDITLSKAMQGRHEI